MKYAVWTLLLWVPTLMLATGALVNLRCDNPNGCFGPPGGWWDRTARPSKLSARSGAPGRKQGW